jgi:hypothetical protein
MPLNATQCHSIPLNATQYHSIPLNTTQYQSVCHLKQGQHDPDSVHGVDLSRSLALQASVYAHTEHWAGALSCFESLLRLNNANAISTVGNTSHGYSGDGEGMFGGLAHLRLQQQQQQARLGTAVALRALGLQSTLSAFSAAGSRLNNAVLSQYSYDSRFASASSGGADDVGWQVCVCVCVCFKK